MNISNKPTSIPRTEMEGPNRDPYASMTFDELDKLHEEEVARMEAAAESRQYELAADIQKKLEPLKAALESKRPLTRDVLEAKISETQGKLNDAFLRKAYLECVQLKSELDKLVEQRLDVPTLDELNEAVKIAEKGEVEAAARRDYSGAASYQAALVIARKRLESSYLTMTFNELNEFHEREVARMEAAAESKQYMLAAAIQEKLEPLKAALESKRPLTRDALEARISKTEEKLNDAVSREPYLECAQLKSELDKLLEQRHDVPTLDEFKEAVKVAEKDVARRDYNGAAAYQTTLDNALKRPEDAKQADPSYCDIVEESVGGNLVDWTGFESETGEEPETDELEMGVYELEMGDHESETDDEETETDDE